MARNIIGVTEEFFKFAKLLKKKPDVIDGVEVLWFTNKATGKPFFVERWKFLDRIRFTSKSLHRVSLQINGKRTFASKSFRDFTNPKSEINKAIHQVLPPHISAKDLVEAMLPFPGTLVEVEFNMIVSSSAAWLKSDEMLLTLGVHVHDPKFALFNIAFFIDQVINQQGIYRNAVLSEIAYAPEFQGKGLIKSFFRRLVPLFDEVGVSSIEARGKGPGEYVFARMGFDWETTPTFDVRKVAVLKFYSWLRRRVPEKVLGTQKEFVKNIQIPLDIANYTYNGKPYGKIFMTKSLAGQSWNGILDLQDPFARSRFEEYVGYQARKRTTYRTISLTLLTRSALRNISSVLSKILKYEYTINPETGELGWFFMSHKTGRPFFLSLESLYHNIHENLHFPIGKDIKVSKSKKLPIFEYESLPNIERRIIGEWFSSNFLIRELLRGNKLRDRGIRLLTKGKAPLAIPGLGGVIIPVPQIIATFERLPYRYRPNGDLSKPIYRGMTFDKDELNAFLSKIKVGEVTYLDNTYASFSRDIEVAEMFIGDPKGVLIEVRKRKHPGWFIGADEEEVIWPAQPVKVISIEPFYKYANDYVGVSPEDVLKIVVEEV